MTGRDLADGAKTAALVALLLPTGAAMIVIEAATNVWAWCDRQAEKITSRPTGKVIGTYDGRLP